LYLKEYIKDARSHERQIKYDVYIGDVAWAHPLHN